MSRMQRTFAIFVLLMVSLIMSDCGPGQSTEPALAPSPTFTLGPTSTPLPSPTLTPTFTITASPTMDLGATATQENSALKQAALQVCQGNAIPAAAVYNPSTPPFPIVFVFGDQNIQTDMESQFSYKDRDLSSYTAKNIQDLQLVLCLSDERITPVIVEECPYVGADPKKIILRPRVINYQIYNIYVAKTGLKVTWIKDPTGMPENCPAKIPVSQQEISSGYDWNYFTNAVSTFLQFAKAPKKVLTPTAVMTPTGLLPTASLAVNDIGLTDVTAISAGRNGDHTCALTSQGEVKCWGNNFYGQLGNGTTNDSTTPVDVSGLSSGVSAISVGYFYTCALTSSGGVKCWGDYIASLLGDSTTSNSATPVDVSGLGSGVSAISTGGFYTCVLTSSGGVKCWGTNLPGRLGDSRNSATPVDVSGLGSGVSAISAGDGTACALTSSGGIKCWGGNPSGELGNNSTAIYSTIPVDVSGLTKGVNAIAVGDDFACALTSAGGVKCWGNNVDGQLGDGTHNNRSAPVNVSGLMSGVIAITTGRNFACALTSSAGVKCWGDNSNGQLGNVSIKNSPTPVDISGLSDQIKAISAGSNFTCAVTSSGRVKCW